MDNNKIKHLDMIEAVIERMARNSFMLKGWAVTLIVGIIAVVAKQEVQYWLVSFIPLIAFWVLDSYYLAIERNYRNLFEKVRETAEEKIDFCMKVKTKLKDVLDAMFSMSEAVFYVALLVGIIVVAVICKVM